MFSKKRKKKKKKKERARERKEKREKARVLQDIGNTARKRMRSVLTVPASGEISRPLARLLSQLLSSAEISS